MKTPLQIFVLICMHFILIILDAIFRIKQTLEDHAPEVVMIKKDEGFQF